MNKLKLWKKQGSYKSFRTGKPMVLVNEDGATVLKPLRKPKTDYGLLTVNALKRMK